MYTQNINCVVGDFLQHYLSMHGVSADTFLRYTRAYGANWGDEALQMIEDGTAPLDVAAILIILRTLNQICDDNLRLADIFFFNAPANAIRISKDLTASTQSVQKILQGAPVSFYTNDSAKADNPHNIAYEMRLCKEACQRKSKPCTELEKLGVNKLGVSIDAFRNWCKALFGRSIDEEAQLHKTIRNTDVNKIGAQIIEDMYREHINRVKYSLHNADCWQGRNINLMSNDELDKLEDDLQVMRDCPPKTQALRQIAFVRQKRAYDACLFTQGQLVFQPDRIPSKHYDDEQPADDCATISSGACTNPDE